MCLKGPCVTARKSGNRRVEFSMKKSFIKLRTAMLEAGVSMSDVARSLGVTRQTISSKFAGRTRWTLDEMLIVAEMVRVDLNVFR